MLAVPLFLLIASADDNTTPAEKPKCTSRIEGRMWPDAANDDKTALLMLARAGKLEMCVATDLGYRWEKLTVNVRSAEKKEKPAAGN
jgi:hypothetical protein